MTARNIKAERQNKGFTQSKLAEMVGTTPQNISNWELGISTPCYPKLKKLSEILEKDIDYLLKPIETTN